MTPDRFERGAGLGGLRVMILLLVQQIVDECVDNNGELYDRHKAEALLRKAFRREWPEIGYGHILDACDDLLAWLDRRAR